MKKTLAAVLAAMMALSTATVALAQDTDVNGSVDETKGGFTVLAPATNPTDVEFDKKAEFALNVNGYVDWLGEALAAGQVKIDVTVTEGRSLLKTAPKVEIHEVNGEKRAVLKLDVKDTFNTDVKGDKDATDISVRVRVTALHADEDPGFATSTDKEWWKKYHEFTGLDKKGDTLSIDAINFDAIYKKIAAYGKDMTITAQEIADNMVVAKGSELLAKLEEKDTDTATFYFGDTAAFTAKIGSSQKDINLHYETKADADVQDAYPEVDFEFIQFNGTPKFARKGTLTFNAIGDADTTVYEVTADGGLEELEIAEYDSIYEIVTVEGVGQLTSYVIASEALEVEAEVEVEEPAVEEENPNTGAC